MGGRYLPLWYGMAIDNWMQANPNQFVKNLTTSHDDLRRSYMKN